MKLIKSKSLPTAVLAVLCLVPIARWFFLEPLSLRFLNLNTTMTSLGQIAGLLGMTIFAINLILSSRSTFFDRIFGGLHRFYGAHRFLGSLSFSLLLFHPLFLVVKYVSVSVRSAALFLLPGNGLAMDAGIWALTLMIILLILTIFVKIKYHVWRISHKVMVVVFVFALVHTFLITSDISRDLFIRYYILFFSVWGLLAGAYRSFFRKFFNNDYEYEIKAVRVLHDKIVELELKPNERAMDFRPGQFIYIRFVATGISSEPHPFSISSSVSEEKIKLVIKSLGDFTSDFDKMRTGMKVMIEGPFGSFFEDSQSDKKEIWIAGGVGITPFLSMARSLKEGNHNIDLYYCVAEKKELVLLAELQTVMSANKKFRVLPWISKEQGRISAKEIATQSGNLIREEIYICGPSAFMKSLTEQFISLGVNDKNIHAEEFSML
ncbi:MAG: ferric reductase-like transmembrane domain-containing protein [bacterium]